MSEMLAAALEDAARGVRVFPLSPPDNIPAIATAHPPGDPLRGKCKGDCGRDGHGFYDATTDPDKIATWWTRWPQANIGCPTGVTFDVLDVDHDDFDTGIGDLVNLEVDDGPVVRTGSGRLHVYFQPTGLGRRIKFHASCDWLGTDGYVVRPPSTHRAGGRYAWIDAHLPLPVAPPDLVALVAPATRAPATDRLPASSTPASRMPGGWSPSGLIARVATAPHGERNSVLNWAALKVGADVRSGKATEHQALAALDELAVAAERAGLTEREVNATIRSGYGAGRIGRAS